MEDSTEKKPRTAVAAGDSGDRSGGDPSGSAEVGGLVNRLPEALLVEVLGRLDVEDACSAAASCRALHATANAAISAVTAIDLSAFAPSNAILSRILAGNRAVRSLAVNCSLLDDSAASAIAKGSLCELSLLKCSFSKDFFMAIGERCRNLRSLKLEMDVSPVILDSRYSGFGCTFLAPIYTGCGYLETLWVKFPLLDPHTVDYETGLPFVPNTIKDLLLQPVSHSRAKTVFPITASLKTHITDSLESLSLVLDTITDELVVLITRNVRNLVELCLEDEPVSQPYLPDDLTNIGLQALGLSHNLRHLSLTRRYSDFRRVNDFGILMLAEGCKQLRTIRLGGFSKVSDAGYAALLHSGKDLKKFEVSNGLCLSDLACLDLDKAAPNITEVRLLSCALLTSETAISLASCTKLKVLDLSGCKSIADSGLVSISQLSELTLLDLAGADITDAGLSALGNKRCPISSLCLRGCKRISSNGIASLLCGTGTIKKTLVSFDLGNVPRISGRAVTVIAKNCEQISNLSLRNCLLITDSSLEMLGSMRPDTGKCSVRMLDLAYCSRLSRNFLRHFEAPLFRGLRWLGVGKNVVERRGCRPTIAQLLERKPGLTICGNACEMGCRNKFHPDIRTLQ
ncbi:F-box protein At-B [Phragmites australis]|uniref:F-box protein At-B n=1 Tax=Phragmites australis TaxID=29695 RepID=UPI002D785A2F|nr:F-box protein At-B [Phragmites australis]